MSVAESMREALGRQLREHEVVDIVAIPAVADPMVRLRTVEEALAEFDDPASEGAISYLVQVKPRRAAVPAVEPTPSPTVSRPTLADHVYLPNGKLNIPYLDRNAEVLFASGDFTLARNIYKTLLQSGERSAFCLYRMGRCFEAEGKLTEARAHYEESIAYQPLLETYLRLSALLMRDKRDAHAAETLERALAMKDIQANARPGLHLACGNSWTRAGKTAEAERHFLKVLELQPSAAEARSNLATLYLSTGRPGDAAPHYEAALAQNPELARSWAGLAACKLALSDKRGAHDAYARSLELEIANPTALCQLVRCAYELKSYPTAARIVEEYVQTQPFNAALLYSLGGLQFHLGRMRDARATLERILELSPGHTGAIELLKRTPVMEDGWPLTPT
jgi:tetratricopeptide (TPR) repeat protein